MVVPERVADPVGSLPSAIVTSPVKVSTTLPSGARAVTSTDGIVAAESTAEGITVNSSRDGACASTALNIESTCVAFSAPL